MIGALASGSIGVSALNLRANIVAAILDLVRTCWASSQANINSTQGEEDLRNVLMLAMRAEKDRRGISMLIQPEAGSLSARNLTAPEGRIDIAVYYAMHEDNHVAIECKRVSSLSGNAADVLISRYVSEGVHRFARSTYSPGHPYAMMLGFVVGGTASACASRVERLLGMRRHTTQCAIVDAWAPATGFTPATDLYSTAHQQTGSTVALVLLHLFLSFGTTAPSAPAATPPMP